MTPEINTAAILGAGAMGAGIAQVAAQAGIQTSLFDISEEFAMAGLAKITAMLDKGVARGKVSEEERANVLTKLTPSWDVEAATNGVDLVIEAVPERLDLKLEIFQKVSDLVRSDTLIATNTSSISITKLAKAVANPSRFLGLHFFNPPPLMPLLEVVHGEETSQHSLDAALSLSKRMGKEPIVVRDSPGFASSRLGVAIGLEAIRMLEEGVASAADIDKAMELGYRFPMGPLKLTDLIGIDVRLDIASYLDANLEGDRFKVPELMRAMVAEGKHGKKTGQGFYTWVDGQAIS
ncbi:MAG: 3-hydroxyacyl-CoA dehydrogenase family protein [Planctomycetota bacterium]|nr:3-hydroxyacyl-CoA dehydrogenase family protein [Planctomycetota bacterium]